MKDFLNQTPMRLLGALLMAVSGAMVIGELHLTGSKLVTGFAFFIATGYMWRKLP